MKSNRPKSAPAAAAPAKRTTKRPKSSAIRKKGLRYIPTDEDLISSKEWLRKYGLNPLGLNLDQLMSSHRHASEYIKITGHRIGAKYCDVFPKVKVRGEKVHMELQHHELVQYEESLDHVISRYLSRWRWLLLGPHRVFGTILEPAIVLCVDTSGSMVTVMEEMKRELIALIWTVLKPNNIKFNILQFASVVTKFQEEASDPTLDMCKAAAKFVGELQAGGNTCTIDALNAALSDSEAVATYLVTDGKPDTSCKAVLEKVASMESRQKVHTIFLSQGDKEAISFLKKLRKETGGRYHCCVEGFEGNVVSHQLLSSDLPASLQGDSENSLEIPEYSGDDLRLLSREIKRARRFMGNSQKYRDLLAVHSGTQEMANLKLQGAEMVPKINPDTVSAFGV